MDHQPRPRSRRLRLWLIIGSVVAALAVLPAAFMGMMSPMASDAGVNATIYTFIFVMLTFPLALLICPIGAWIAYGLRQERISWVLLFLPWLWVAAIAAIFLIGFGAVRPA